MLALIGLSSRCAGRVWLAVAWNSYTVYPSKPYVHPFGANCDALVVLMDAFSRFSPAALRSLLSKSVETDQQGRLFSLISVVEVVGSLLASLAFHTLFPWSIPFFPQLAFVLMGLVMLVPVFLIWYAKASRVRLSQSLCFSWNLRELNREPAGDAVLRPPDLKTFVTQGLVRCDAAAADGEEPRR